MASIPQTPDPTRSNRHQGVDNQNRSDKSAIDTKAHAQPPSLLIILDGWGHSETSESNAIAAANTPFWDQLWRERPHTLISGSGPDVGLPEGQMGNSEVGHMTIGSGRVLYQDISRISQSIEDGSLSDNSVLCSNLEQVNQTKKSIHLLGLLSPGGVHSHEDHFFALMALALKKGATRLFLHIILDGRDTPPKSAQASLDKLQAHIDSLTKKHPNSTVTPLTMMGRYFAMDRDQRWERIEPAYQAIAHANATFSASTPSEALAAAYARGESDEFVQPTCIDSQHRLQTGDLMLFTNFRSDRARQITQCFIDPEFDHFDNTGAKPTAFLTMTQYAKHFTNPCLFPPQVIHNSLAEVLAKQQKTQLRISETEKYAHVTFFFSGGREAEFEGETRILIPSPKVNTYDQKPEMSAYEVTDQLCRAIESGQQDFIVCNFANGDMVGHTGNYNAALKAAEVIDDVLQRVIQSLIKAGGQCLITADHGNIEQMVDTKTQQPHTAHTCEPVPLIYVTDNPAWSQRTLLKETGTLADIAPTILDMMTLNKPKEMSGRSLLLTDNQG